MLGPHLHPENVSKLSLNVRASAKPPSMKRFLFVALTLATAVHAQIATPATQKRLDDLKKGYESAVTRQAAPAFSSAIKALDVKYLGALDRLITSSTLAGKLDEAIALRDEKKRVTGALPLPETDADAPEALRPLRGTYRDQLAAITAARDKTTAPLTERYLQELDKLQADCTKASLLDDGIAVRAVRDAFKTGTTGRQTSDPGSLVAQPAAANIKSKSDPVARRQLIEWGLENKATLRVRHVGGKVGDIAEMPKGTVELLRIVIAEIGGTPVETFPWPLLAGAAELEVLSLKLIQVPTAQDVQHLSGLSNLQTFELHNIRIPAGVLEAMPPLPALDRLFFTGGAELDAFMELFAQRYPAVTQFSRNYYMPQPKDGEAFCLALKGWSKLKHLRIQANLTEAMLAHLGRLPNLERLMLYTGSEYSPAALSQLRHLKVLQINAPLKTPGYLEAIAQLPKLEDLNIDLDGMTSIQCAPLTRVKGIRTLTLVNIRFPDSELAAFLESFRKVADLTLGDCAIGPLTGLSVGGFGALRSLELINAQISDDVLKALQRSLPKCSIVRNQS